MHRFLCAALAFGASVALAAPSAKSNKFNVRNIVDQIEASYDFVVVGGGLAGLVLGARLSEDANHTVLVLESGGTGDDLRDRIDTPGDTYYKSLWPTDLNWAFETTPQAGANGAQLVWPRGKVLGGSSAINGLYLNRPSEIEVNAWQNMLGKMDGADNWSWDNFFTAMKKSETFTPPTDAVVQEAAVTWNAASHGTNGPIHMSYPGYTFPQVGQWSQAMQNAGVADSHDTYGGETWGAYVATSAINPTNWTRSYSRSGYLDPLPPRSNYDVLVNAHVTRLLFDSSSPAGNLTANMVEYTTDGGNTKSTVKVNKEVILAGGSVGSPAVLLYSGVGPKDVLSAAGVTLVSELPGVGQHLQDHLSVSVQWSTDQPTAGSVYDDNTNNEQNNAVFLSYVNSAVAYVNATVLLGSGLPDFQAGILSEESTITPPGTSDANVLAGYKAIYSITAKTILTSQVGQIEYLFANNGDGAIRITTALQHPFSQGRIYINSSNPVDYPVIDPNYLAHPADVTILREGLKLARRIGEASPLSSSMTNETSPGATVQSDADWESWLRNQLSTEFHPSSTCAMLPLNQGGVVDAHLRVYGLANVRVADASVPPFVVSAHLMASTYGLAERASEIIRQEHNIKAAAKGSTASSGSESGGAVPTEATSVSAATSNAAASAVSASSGTNQSHTARNVAIGVCVPLGLIALFAGLWFCLMRSRRQRDSSRERFGSAIGLETSSTKALDKDDLDRSSGEDDPTQSAAGVAGAEASEKEKQSRVSVSEVLPPAASTNVERFTLAQKRL